MDHIFNILVEESRTTIDKKNINIGGYNIPVRCKGKLKSPKCLPNLESIILNISKDRIEDKLKSILKKEINEALNEDRKKILKSILNF